jgi:AcrR family transcriptional regulator
VPRLIDYVGRFEFIRQAAFAVVRDEGVDALSRRRVAAELGSSVNTIRRLVADRVDLVRLAADQVVSRRRVGRFSRRTTTTLEAVDVRVRMLMPEDPSHLDEELVWLKLVTACALKSSGLEPPGSVRRDFGIAQRGYDDGHPVAPVKPRPESGTKEDRRTALERYVTERDEVLTTTVDQVLDLLEVPEPRCDVATTMIAVIEGLTLAACLGRIAPERATDLAVAHALAVSGSDERPEDAA